MKTFKELIDETEWDNYGVGNYEKCANCMVHCGFEGTAVRESVTNPLKLMKVAIGGIKTEGKMAPEIPLDKQRPADYVFSAHVERKLHEIRTTQPRAKKTAAVS